MLKYSSLLVFLSLFLLPEFNFAQSSNYLKIEKNVEYPFTVGLSKLSNEELMERSASLQLDITKIKVYLADGTTLEPMQLMEYLKDKTYKTEIFQDENKEIKALVLVKKSVEEMNLEEIANNESKESVSDFNFKTLLGNEYSIKDLKGKITVLNFWFTSCKPCLMEIPELNEIVNHYKDAPIRFIAPSFENEEVLKDFLTKKSFEYEIGIQANSIIKYFDVSSYPTHIILDENGNIIFQTSGLTANTIQDLKNNIDQALKKMNQE